MISAAAPSYWGSPLEDLSSAGSAAFITSEGPIHHGSADFQLSAFSLQDSHDAAFGTGDELPAIDESLFDFFEVPDLEEVEVDERSSPAAIAPLEDLLLEQIPPLEEPVLSADAWFEWPEPKADKDNLQWDPTTPTIVVSEEVVSVEEVVTSSPVSMYVESCGSDSPLSCYSMVSDELSVPAEKRRRVSQISMSSYCSSNGDSTWSPTSASDSDVDSRRMGGGRRSRFSPEDRKERKKAQNRTAAERYRQKRKLQEETIDEEEQGLIDGINELKTEVTKLQAEKSCLKRLMREMLQARGIVIPPPRKKTA